MCNLKVQNRAHDRMRKGWESQSDRGVEYCYCTGQERFPASIFVAEELNQSNWEGPSSSRWRGWSGLSRTDKFVHCPPLHQRFHGVQCTGNHGACLPDRFVQSVGVAGSDAASPAEARNSALAYIFLSPDVLFTLSPSTKHFHFRGFQMHCTLIVSLTKPLRIKVMNKICSILCFLLLFLNKNDSVLMLLELCWKVIFCYCALVLARKWRMLKMQRTVAENGLPEARDLFKDPEMW